ncbi:MAG: SDR family oxidoreductase [Alphaproteobacteria bacterium]|nr:SDR family oxidoreductase [Alphaproteobacteria bacterium]
MNTSSAKPLDGQIALVTGASRGIGAEIAFQLAEKGAHIIAAARTQGGLEELDDRIQAIGGSATLLPIDLGKLDEVDKIGPSLAERFGKLDILVANAGMLGPLSPVTHIRPKEFENVMTLNFMSNVRLVRSVDPLMRTAPAARGVFLTSLLAQKPMAYWGPYCASKAALETFAQTYALETKETNMKINAVHPGIVDTKMLQGAFPGGFPGATKTPEQAATDIIPFCLPTCDKHGEIILL